MRVVSFCLFVRCTFTSDLPVSVCLCLTFLSDYASCARTEPHRSWRALNPWHHEQVIFRHSRSLFRALSHGTSVCNRIVLHYGSNAVHDLAEPLRKCLHNVSRKVLPQPFSTTGRSSGAPGGLGTSRRSAGGIGVPSESGISSSVARKSSTSQASHHTSDSVSSSQSNSILESNHGGLLELFLPRFSRLAGSHMF